MAKWWDVRNGDKFSKTEIVRRCTDYIHSSAFSGNVAEKRQKIGMIERKPVDVLEYHPVGAGWGKSPLNHKCWLTQGIPLGTQKKSLVPKHLSRYAKLFEDIPGSKPKEKLPARDYANQPQINQRPWGAAYRSAVLRLWGECAVTGCKSKKLLTASHILPVNQCVNENEMRDEYNGIALTPTFDKLFDSGYITFHDNGRVIITSLLNKADRNSIGLDETIVIALPERSKKYMAYHREHVFKK